MDKLAAVISYYALRELNSHLAPRNDFVAAFVEACVEKWPSFDKGCDKDPGTSVFGTGPANSPRLK